MKLKNLLLLAFSTLTLAPVILVSYLLYKSGVELSRESYLRNLIESISVQEDYIAQTLKDNMIVDYRFANVNRDLISADLDASKNEKTRMLSAFQSYLASSEDKINACMLLNKDDIPVYTIGEDKVVQNVIKHLPSHAERLKQSIMEFEVEPGVYSLGIVTPILTLEGGYEGAFVSVYTKYYIFKIISSYYTIANTDTYICRENGDAINSMPGASENQNVAILHSLTGMALHGNSIIDANVQGHQLVGYYKNIQNSPWYLVGFINEETVYSFANNFIVVYLAIIIGVLIADLLLAFYISKKVVAPIKNLIQFMDQCQNKLTSDVPEYEGKVSYFEIQYLRTKFAALMRAIMLVQHNFEGVYQLYQSNDMGDTNIDIDVKHQTISSNKDVFQNLLRKIEVPKDACIVERFTRCFCDDDQRMLMNMFEVMRDEHLSVARETEIFTHHIGGKWYHTLVVPMYEDDRLSRLFVQLRDISSFKMREHESNEKAKRDPLTGLYNRAGFISCANSILNSKEGAASHGLLFIDMDFFKLVNDNLGHTAGDSLLCEVAQILRENTGPEALVSRFGGDEFAIFLPRATTAVLDTVKERLSAELIYPFTANNLTFTVSASIGVSMWNFMAPITLEEMVHQADINMYLAKRKFKSEPSDA